MFSSAVGPSAAVSYSKPQPSSTDSQDFQVRGVVVDRQHAQAREIGVRPAVAAGIGVAGSSRTLNQNVEPRSGFALDADLAPHQLDQSLRDRQAQSGAAVFARGRGVDLRERLEQPVACGRRECRCRCRCTAKRTMAVVVDRRIRPRRPDHDLAPLGELDRVADQVDEHLPQPVGIAVNTWRAPRARMWQASSSPLSSARWANISVTSSSSSVQVEIDARRVRACRPRSWRNRGCR